MDLVEAMIMMMMMMIIMMTIVYMVQTLQMNLVDAIVMMMMMMTMLYMVHSCHMKFLMTMHSDVPAMVNEMVCHDFGMLGHVLQLHLLM